MKITKLLFLLIFLKSNLLAQSPTQPNVTSVTSANERLVALNIRQKLTENSLLNSITYRNIGPTVQSGRVVDVDVNPNDPSIFYVCYASGGLWKTESNGSEMTPIFDNQAVMTIGDVAVNWDKKIIWLGTGENNASRSSYAGVGIYKSTDDGKTWQNMGLSETHHIGRIVLHPTNPDIVWVAALGHLYSPNKERGVYMTSDGGKTWKQTLFVDENSGAIDIVVDENDPSVLYASTWTRERQAWNFKGSGKGSGIYKSTDGGATWQLTTTEGAGFPTGPNAGRIGLALAKKGNSTLVYAVIDNQTPSDASKKTEAANDGIKKEELKTMSKDKFLALDKKKITAFLKLNDFPEKYKADDIIEKIKSDKISVQTLYDYIDTGDDGFSNPNGIVGLEVYRSEDNGKTWKRTHDKPISEIFFTYGYYFAQIRVAANNPDKLYVLGYHAISSNDGGKTWRNLDKDNVHADHHALWVNPNRSGHLINGNDGGINITYNDGKTWIKCNTPSVGQYYHVNVDMNEPYNVYGGLQDNGVWFGSSMAEPNVKWANTGQYEFRSIMGGDGMQTMIDTRDNNTVYTGFQFGNYVRTSTKYRAKPEFITPRHDLGEKPLRFNWQTPIWLSQHNQDVLYFGANKLYRSMDKGNNWESISGDLTKGRKNGNVPYGTLSAIHESPLKFGLIYTGSDDGLIHITRDGGNTWTKITEGLPSDLWVSRVQASAHNKATVYASFNGYRSDDFNSYLYISTNYGENWTRIGTDLPAEPINVVKEDPKNPNILYIGTDHSLYVSLNKGKTFQTMNNGLPNVAVHDLVVHPRDNELVVGTHGRSLYIADVQYLQQLDEKTLAKDLVVFDIKKMTNNHWGMQSSKWDEVEPVMAKIAYYAKSEENATISISAGKNLILSKSYVVLKKGLNYADVDMTFDQSKTPQYQTWLNVEKKEKETKPIELKQADDGKFYLQKGKYIIIVEKTGLKLEKELIIE